MKSVVLHRGRPHSGSKIQMVVREVQAGRSHRRLGLASAGSGLEKGKTSRISQPVQEQARRLKQVQVVSWPPSLHTAKQATSVT